MHEHGLGVPSPDFHLSKRYYDSCLDTNSDAIVPVKLALAHLYAKAYWKEWMPEGWTNSQTETEETTITQNNADANKPADASTMPNQPAPSSSVSSTPAPSTRVLAPLPGPVAWLRDQFALIGLTGWFERLWQFESTFDLFLAIEDTILAVLCGVFAIIVYYRAQR